MFDGVETCPYTLFNCIGASVCENTVSFLDTCNGLFYVPYVLICCYVYASVSRILD